MPRRIAIASYIAAWSSSPFAKIDGPPWGVTQQAEALILSLFPALVSDYRIENNIAIHRSAIVEAGAVLKGPAIIGPECFLAAGAYLRGGVYLERGCSIGPGTEVKTSFLFFHTKLAHFNFIGDSILGGGVNLEAGAIIANHRNECDDKRIRIVMDGVVVETDAEKFGALIGDRVRIGANAVVAPGALIPPGTSIQRLQLVDQSPRDAAI